MKTTHFFLFLLCCAFFLNCASEKTELPSEKANRDLTAILASDTLRVATMRGATSYFVYRNQTLGYNYELISDFARHLNLVPDIRLVNTEQELTDLLSAGKIDIIAYNLVETKERKTDFHFVFPRFQTHKVLIQRFGRNALQDASQLAGKTVHVRENSIYHRRLKTLNKEIGGTINIAFVPDSLIGDDLIRMTLDSEIDFTIAFFRNAAVHRVYHSRLNHHVPVGFAQQNGWLISKKSPELFHAFENWAKLPATQRLQWHLENRHIVQNRYLASQKTPIRTRTISPYDDLFQRFAPIVGWDWQLLAAIAFHESTFNSSAVSPVGASGLMQLMPRTAEIFDLDSISVFKPEKNVEAAALYLRELNRLFSRVENSNERIKFILAAYNGGRAHVFDAMALAERYGKNPHVWHNNVEYFLYQKRNPDFHQNPLVRHGSFNAWETIQFVENVMSTYERFIN